MKKTLLIIALALALVLPSSLWAATPGVITQALVKIQNSNMAILTFTCTASVDDASFPSTAVSAEITAAILGMYITEVRTDPGATAPTALYDIALNSSMGIDLMGGVLADRSATVSEAALPYVALGTYWPRAVDGILTLAITGNAVNSAVVVVKVYLSR